MNNPIQKQEESPEAQALRQRLAKEDSRRRRLERDRARCLRDGEDAPGLSAADLKALKAADALEAKAVKGQRGAPGIRAQASRLRSVVGDALIARAEARRADLRLVQTVELDAVREGMAVGEVLETKRGQIGKRLRTRDGLKLLHERGAFTPKSDDGRAMVGLAARIEADRLLSVGLRYRDRYEIAQASLKSCLDTGDGIRRPGNFYTQGKAAHRRAALANQVRVLDIAVVQAVGEDGLLVLRAVAGEARTITSLTTSGARRDRLSGVLVKALRVVAQRLENGR